MQCRVELVIPGVWLFETDGESNTQHPDEASEPADRNRWDEQRRAAR